MCYVVFFRSSAYACTAPDTTGYAVTETELTALSFDVTIACADGYSGTAAVTGCSATGNTAGDYSVSGCAGMQCMHVT
jgi:hypothetical protein